MIDQLSHDGWYWLKDSCKVCYQSLVGLDPSIVSHIGRFLARVLLSRYVISPIFGFVFVLDKSFARRVNGVVCQFDNVRQCDC